LRQLDTPGAMDELGITTIRRAFSDILFPGTSTAHTRAKYLFIVPYLCWDIQGGKELTKKEFLQMLEAKEVKLMKKLAVDGAEGVIGKVSGQNIQRLPSNIYWKALRKYGFFTKPLTLSEYASQFSKMKKNALYRKNKGKPDSSYEDDSVDDKDTDKIGCAFWNVQFDKGWEKNVAIDLTKQEAQFLKEMILDKPNLKDSLLALIIRENCREFCDYKQFSDIDNLKKSMPASIWKDYRLARDFAEFIFGAQARYNVIYSEGQNDGANDEWNKYDEKRPTINLKELQDHIRLRQRRELRSDMWRFLEQFQNALGKLNTHGKPSELDELIIERERRLKSPARSKLSNKEYYPYNDNFVGMAKLNYRFTTVQRMVRDIFEGLRS
jgi:hypothetical protein